MGRPYGNHLGTKPLFDYLVTLIKKQCDYQQDLSKITYRLTALTVIMRNKVDEIPNRQVV